MKGRVFDVVAYITRNYGLFGCSAEDPSDLRDELLQAGFEEDDVERALTWLRRLRSTRPHPGAPMRAPSQAVRLPTPEEAVKLTAGARGFLLRLERSGILDPAAREAVYERALTLDLAEVGLEEMRVLAALVLEASPSADDHVVASVLENSLDGLYH